MRFAIALILISTTLWGCSVIPPRHTTLTHAVTPCAAPASNFTLVFKNHATGSCTWARVDAQRREADCVVQTPRDHLYSDVGAGVRACFSDPK
jgi:hypothetical protein